MSECSSDTIVSWRPYLSYTGDAVVVAHPPTYRARRGGQWGHAASPLDQGFELRGMPAGGGGCTQFSTPGRHSEPGVRKCAAQLAAGPCMHACMQGPAQRTFVSTMVPIRLPSVIVLVAGRRPKGRPGFS